MCSDKVQSTSGEIRNGRDTSSELRSPSREALRADLRSAGEFAGAAGPPSGVGLVGAEVGSITSPFFLKRLEVSAGFFGAAGALVAGLVGLFAMNGWVWIKTK